MAKKSEKFEFSKIGSLIDEIAKKTPIYIEKTDKEIDYISTGVYILNAVLTGSIFNGIKGDAITVFAGPETSGKTYLSLGVCREAQNKGYGIIYIDTENTIHRQDLSKYGIDNDINKFILIKSNKVEDINMTLSQLLDELKVAQLAGQEISKTIIIIDSLAQMASNKEKEDLVAGRHKADMTKAKAIGSFFRSITIDLGYLNIPMIVNNQTYKTMDMFPQDVMKGGKSLYYSASSIIMLSKAKLKTGEEDEYDFQSGVVVTAKALKNRQAKPKRVKFEISYEKGCNPYIGLDMFCIPKFFDQIGIAKGKFEKFDVPQEFVDEDTGEVCIREGQINPTGNRWYIKHLDKYVFTKSLFTKEIFTEEILQAIEPIANAYFKYKSLEEAEKINEDFEGSVDKSNDEYQDIDLDSMNSEDLFG